MSAISDPQARRPNPWLLAACYLVLTGLPLAAGLAVGRTLVRPAVADQAPIAWRDALRGANGEFYAEIADHGYTEPPGFGSSAAFFPLYSLCARGIAACFSVDSETALLAVSLLAWAAVLVLAVDYFGRRSGPSEHYAPDFAVLALGLAPGAYFWHAMYAESLLTAFILGTLWLLERRAPLWAAAVVAALAGATRPPGIAVALPVLLAAYRRSATKQQAVLRCAGLGLLCCTGLVGVMVWQWLALGDPLAFVHAQAAHTIHNEPVGWLRLLRAWGTLEPLWAVYVEGSPAFWLAAERHPLPWASARFFNPPIFAACVALICLGWRKHWLNAEELALAAGLLAIPYLTRGYQYGLAGFTRFTLPCVPAYLVLGRGLAGLPAPLSGLAILASGLAAVWWAALVAAGYDLN